MSKQEKLLARLLSLPSDMTIDEVAALLRGFGLEMGSRGKTSGSAIAFLNRKTGRKLYLHSPHPQNIVKRYVLKLVIAFLRSDGLIEKE